MFSKDILFIIYSFLDLRSSVNCSQVSKWFNLVYDDENLWKKLIIYYFNEIIDEVNLIIYYNEIGSYKKIFKNFYHDMNCNIFLSAYVDDRIKVLNIKNNSIKEQNYFCKGYTRSICLSSDCQFMAYSLSVNEWWEYDRMVCNSDPQIYLVNLDTEIRTRLGSHKLNINCLSFSYDNKLIASGSNDKIIQIFNISEGKTVYKLEDEDKITSVCFTKDNSCTFVLFFQELCKYI